MYHAQAQVPEALQMPVSLPPGNGPIRGCVAWLSSPRLSALSNNSDSFFWLVFCHPIRREGAGLIRQGSEALARPLLRRSAGTVLNCALFLPPRSRYRTPNLGVWQVPGTLFAWLAVSPLGIPPPVLLHSVSDFICQLHTLETFVAPSECR